MSAPIQASTTSGSAANATLVNRPILLSYAAPENPAPPPKVEFPKPIPAPKPIQGSITALTNVPFKMLLPGLFELGSVRLDKRERTVTFPGIINMTQGPLEYLLVTRWGKTHESVLRTDVEPLHIHVAMLLLSDGSNLPGNPTAGTNSPAPAGGEQFISKPSKDPIPGEQVIIEVSWRQGDQNIRRRAEELVFNDAKKATMTNAIWVYNGSRILSGNFMAQLGGSVVSLISDPDAQINSMTVGHDDDRIWMVNTNQTTTINEPVQITIRLAEQKK